MSFAVAETLYTIPSDFATRTSITEIIFDEPAEFSHFRYWKEFSGYGSLAELEFIPVNVPYKPEISITLSDYTNFYPVITVECPTELYCSTCRIERAMSPTGPWVAASDWFAPGGDPVIVTDKDLYVGIKYFYRVLAYSDHPYFPDDTASSTIESFTRFRRLDRDWNDLTTLNSGISIMKGTNGLVQSQWTRPFDGDVSTWPDIFDAYAKGPVGLNFGENVWVGGIGYICRNDDRDGYTRISPGRVFCSKNLP